MAELKPMIEQIASGNQQIRTSENSMTDIERVKTFAERCTDTDLVAQHVTLGNLIANAQAEQLVLEDVLEGRFPAEKTREQIVTPYGVAERKVTNSYFPDTEKMDELKAKLGPRFEEYIKETDKYRLAKAKVEELIQRLGPDSDEFFFHNVDYSATRKATDELMSDDGGELADFINVAQSIHVKVTPTDTP